LSDNYAQCTDVTTNVPLQSTCYKVSDLSEANVMSLCSLLRNQKWENFYTIFKHYFSISCTNWQNQQ